MTDDLTRIRKLVHGRGRRCPAQRCAHRMAAIGRQVRLLLLLLLLLLNLAQHVEQELLLWQGDRLTRAIGPLPLVLLLLLLRRGQDGADMGVQLHARRVRQGGGVQGRVRRPGPQGRGRQLPLRGLLVQPAQPRAVRPAQNEAVRACGGAQGTSPSQLTSVKRACLHAYGQRPVVSNRGVWQVCTNGCSRRWPTA